MRVVPLLKLANVVLGCKGMTMLYGGHHNHICRQNLNQLFWGNSPILSFRRRR